MCFVFIWGKNSDLCHLQHKMIGFSNRVEKCLLRGTDWVFKESRLRFVFKRLILSDLCVSFLPACPLFPFPSLLFSSYWPQGLKNTIGWSTVATKVLVGIFCGVGWSFRHESLCSRQAVATAGRRKILICLFLVTNVLIFWPLNFKNFCHPDYNISWFFLILVVSLKLYSIIPLIL
jgi:hypothetical protein